MSSFHEPINIEDEQQASDDINDDEELDEDQIDDYKDMIQQLGTFPVSTIRREHNYSSSMIPH
jgi:hypothetical protein